MKWKYTGELNVQSEYFRIYQFGRTGWIGLGNLTEEDKSMAELGLHSAKHRLKEMNPDLVILDEVCLAVHCNLLTVEDISQFLQEIPEGTDVILTGRYASPELIALADIAIELKVLKEPKDIVSKEGINY